MKSLLLLETAHSLTQERFGCCLQRVKLIDISRGLKLSPRKRHQARLALGASHARKRRAKHRFLAGATSVLNFFHIEPSRTQGLRIVDTIESIDPNLGKIECGLIIHERQ